MLKERGFRRDRLGDAATSVATTGVVVVVLIIIVAAIPPSSASFTILFKSALAEKLQLLTVRGNCLIQGIVNNGDD